MTPRQRETGLTVLEQRISCRLKTCKHVAKVAPVRIIGGKFTTVLIEVTTGAIQLARVIDSGAASGLVALGTIDDSVLSFQRERTRSMSGDIERGGAKAGIAMAGRTIGPCCAGSKLSVVGVAMAILTAFVRNGAMEVGAFMTGLASYISVLAGKRELRQLVIKVRTDMAILPTRGGVAVVARAPETGVAESTLMGIRVT